MNLKQELEMRGFLHQYTDEKLFEIYDKGGESLYWGIDPSGDSFQMGNLISLINALHFMKKGNKGILIVGGATGMIGNPTGKDAERNFLSEEALQHNLDSLTKQAKEVTQNIMKKTGFKLEIEVVNNYDFFRDMNVIGFMREVGKYMTVNRMMNKDIVRKRITDPDKFISYAEFSYMLLMGYDFYRLYVDKGVKLEVGGSDEWDGIISGIELIGKKTGQTAYGMTNKLILDSTGKKFGKSEGNAIWLSKEKNSPYFVYQYLLNLPDEDVERFLKLLTFMSFEEISEIVQKHEENPQSRFGQKALAYYVIDMIFGTDEANTAQKISEVLFGAQNSLELITKMSDTELQALYAETGGIKVSNPENNILDLLVSLELVSSKGEAKKLIESGGVYLNENKITDIGMTTAKSDFISDKVCLVRKGKKSYKLVLIG